MNEHDKILTESTNYKLTHEFECPKLYNKNTKETIYLKNHYGDPSCGLIDEKEKWCIVAGEGIVLYNINSNKEYVFLREKLYSIHSIKFFEINKLKILIDPWSKNHGIWILNLNDLKLEKISSEPDLREMPYKEFIDF